MKGKKTRKNAQYSGCQSEQKNELLCKKSKQIYDFLKQRCHSAEQQLIDMQQIKEFLFSQCKSGNSAEFSYLKKFFENIVSSLFNFINDEALEHNYFCLENYILQADRSVVSYQNIYDISENHRIWHDECATEDTEEEEQTEEESMQQEEQQVIEWKQKPVEESREQKYSQDQYSSLSSSDQRMNKHLYDQSEELTIEKVQITPKTVSQEIISISESSVTQKLIPKATIPVIPIMLKRIKKLDFKIKTVSVRRKKELH